MQRYESQCNEEYEHWKAMIKSNDGDYVLYANHMAEKEAWRDNKRDLENDLALKMEQIATLTDDNAKQAEEIGRLKFFVSTTGFQKDYERENIAYKDVLKEADNDRE